MSSATAMADGRSAVPETGGLCVLAGVGARFVWDLEELTETDDRSDAHRLEFFDVTDHFVFDGGL
jgi:hypothetical protein